MEAKLCLCLMLIIFGTLTVQGAIPRNNKKNPLNVFARQIPCDDGGICVEPQLPPECPPYYYPCDDLCLGFLQCCCPDWRNSK